MAIVVKTQPGTYQSVHGDLLYVVHEATKANDPVTYPDYRYLADVYAAGVLVTRLKAYPDPVTGMGIFNISNVLRNYITPVFNPLANTWQCQTLNTGDWNVSGTVVFGEEYGFTQFPATINGVGRTFFGHYNGRMLGTLTNLSSYYGKIASVRPNRTPMYRNANFCFIPYFQNDTDIDIVINQYDAEGGSLLSSIASRSAFDSSMNIFNIASPGIADFNGLGILENAHFITVDFPQNSNRLLTIDIVCEPKHTVYTVHFLNRFGGFESRDFTKLSRKLIDIEKRDFGKLPYTVNASGDVSYYNSNNVYNETRSVYASQYKEKMTLNTDVLTDAEYTWLGDLVLSPMVFIEMGGYFIPIVISQTNYEFRKAVNDKVTNLTIEIQFGEQFNAQYR